MTRIVIIGASVAGHTTAIKLREQDKDCSITLLTEENYPSYDRRRLLEFFAGTIKEEEIFLNSEDFYQKNEINFIKGKEVDAINQERRLVYFKEKGNIEYDFLIIASGRSVSLPEITGIRKEGVFTLHSLDDFKILRNQLFHDTICVVGSDEHALNLGKLIASKYKVGIKLISHNEFDSSLILPGIEVIQSQLQEIIGEGMVEAIKLEQGKAIGVSMVVFMDELKGNIDFLKNTDIKICEDLILIDEGMRTSGDRIFACGSVASRKEALGKIKIWDDAIMDSICVVGNFIKQKKEQTCQTY